VTIHKAITEGIEAVLKEREAEREALGVSEETLDKVEYIKRLEEEMERLAEDLRFEEAAQLRDRILELQGQKVARGIGGLKRKPRRSYPDKAQRGMEAPAPYGRKRWRRKS
jgi:excinuclease UvrABC nuclease subunit